VHVVHINLAFDEQAPDAPALLERHATLRGWAAGLRGAGVRVSVIQRFREAAMVVRDGQTYELIAAGSRGRMPLWAVPRRVHRRARELAPDVVHVHGLDAPAALWDLRRTLPTPVALVAQDHASVPPIGLATGPRALAGRAIRRAGMRAADALWFTAAAQAEPWRASGLMARSQPVYEILEASTTLHEEYPGRDVAEPPDAPGPAVLWVGRLNANKDPLTVVDGFRGLLAHRPEATLTMVCGSDDLRPELEARVRAEPALRASVRLVERLDRAALAAQYAAADVFVSGSHREGSGYALIEALAFGLAPAVTAIPSVRVITRDGAVGALWEAGDALACTRALLAAAAPDRLETRKRCRAHFDATLSWAAVGRAARAAYAEIVERRLGAR
jgi:glycosyltransferase involved in cell wall biosynthesis